MGAPAGRGAGKEAMEVKGRVGAGTGEQAVGVGRVGGTWVKGEDREDQGATGRGDRAV